MGTECVCLGHDQPQQMLQALERQNNSKFFYYSDPKLLREYQDKLQSVQQAISKQRRIRESIHQAQLSLNRGDGSRSSRRHSQYSAALGHLSQMSQLERSISTQATSQLRQIESRIAKESFAVWQSLEMEKRSGWSDAIP